MKERTEERTEAEKKQLKDRIITELYNSGAVQKKCAGFLFRNSIKQDTQIGEDSVQETFYWLSRYPTDKLIEAYEDNPNRVLALCVTILRFKCFSRATSGYPRHSLAWWILNFSNLNSLSYYDSTEEGEESKDNNRHFVLADQPDAANELWETVRGELTATENQDLDMFLNLEKKRGQLKKDMKERYNNLLKRIEDIITENGLKV